MLTHYFENSVKRGSIFYRWPGAVFYTVYGYPRKPDGSNDMTYSQRNHEAGVFQMKGCYCGGSGTWIIVRGGLYTDENERVWPRDLELTLSTKEEVFQNGTLTNYSHDRYHKKEGLRCTENCPHCTS